MNRLLHFLINSLFIFMFMSANAAEFDPVQDWTTIKAMRNGNCKDELSLCVRVVTAEFSAYMLECVDGAYRRRKEKSNADDIFASRLARERFRQALKDWPPQSRLDRFDGAYAANNQQGEYLKFWRGKVKKDLDFLPEYELYDQCTSHLKFALAKRFDLGEISQELIRLNLKLPKSWEEMGDEGY